MNDKEYFEHYKQAFETVFSSRTEDHVYIKDADFKYRTMTDSMLQFIGAENMDEVVGYSTEELAAKFGLAKEMAEQYTKQNVQIQKLKKRSVFLETFTQNGQAKIFVVYKTPIINPHTDNFVGIRGEITNLLWPHAIKTLFKMHGTKGLLLGHKNNANAWKDYPLTNMQHMVLFLCLNNYSYSEIALLLNEFGHEITPIRVNDYLEQLKLIFHVRNKTQLIEKAIGLNFHVSLPEGLFNKLTSIEISGESASIISAENN